MANSRKQLTLESWESWESCPTEEDCEVLLTATGLGLGLWDWFWSLCDRFGNQWESCGILEPMSRTLEKVWRRKLVQAYVDRFLNRGDCYSLQWIDGDGGCQYAYKKLGDVDFEADQARLVGRHLLGIHTLSIPAIDGEGTCKWCVWDSDTANGDLLKIKEGLERLGLNPVRESVREGRDGHLWLFFDKPVKASGLLLFNGELLGQLDIDPLSIEFFPKSATKHSQIRAPLGIHKKPGANNTRGYFEGVPTGSGYWLDAQMVFVAGLKSDDPAVIEAVATKVESLQVQEKPKRWLSVVPDRVTDRPPILSLVRADKRAGDDLVSACPACVREGGDSHADNLRINAVNPRAFNCVHNGPGFGHSTSEIWQALGY